jgi:hypothetical protein
VNNESQKKGKMVERYKSPSPTFNDEHARVMELIKRIIPCTYCGSHNHCVAVCWKQKVYRKKIMVTRSTPRQDDATLQVKKNCMRIQHNQDKSWENPMGIQLSPGKASLNLSQHEIIAHIVKGMGIVKIVVGSCI